MIYTPIAIHASSLSQILKFHWILPIEKNTGPRHQKGLGLQFAIGDTPGEDPPCPHWIPLTSLENWPFWGHTPSSDAWNLTNTWNSVKTQGAFTLPQRRANGSFDCVSTVLVGSWISPLRCSSASCDHEKHNYSTFIKHAKGSLHSNLHQKWLWWLLKHWACPIENQR